MINLEMLFICLSITNRNKVMSRIKPSMAATQGRFGNPRICTVSHQAALLSSQLSDTNYQILGTGISWVDINRDPSGRVQARVAVNVTI